MNPKRKDESPEKCILSSEVAKAWSVGRSCVLRLFVEEPGVAWVETRTSRGRVTRELSIPESVLTNVYRERLSKRARVR